MKEGERKGGRVEREREAEGEKGGRGREGERTAAGLQNGWHCHLIRAGDRKSVV